MIRAGRKCVFFPITKGKVKVFGGEKRGLAPKGGLRQGGPARQEKERRGKSTWRFQEKKKRGEI